MYDDLIQELRHGEFEKSTSMSRQRLMNKAANAIEILSRHDAEIDEIARQACEIRMAVCCGTMDELVEIALEGRLLVLPCPIGTEVYRVATRLCKYCDDDCARFCACVDGFDVFCLNYTPHYVILKVPFSPADLEDYGKTVFLTEEAARDALKELKEMEGQA